MPNFVPGVGLLELCSVGNMKHEKTASFPTNNTEQLHSFRTNQPITRLRELSGLILSVSSKQSTVITSPHTTKT